MYPIGWFHENIWKEVLVEDQVVRAAVLEEGAVVVPRLVCRENPASCWLTRRLEKWRVVEIER